MHKTERPNYYFFNTHTHNQVEQIKKCLFSNLYPNFVRYTPDFEHSRVPFNVE